jgi:CheY-like chemotaxis protein
MFFAAKIRSTAEAAGSACERIKSQEEMERSITTAPPSLVIIDLNGERNDPLKLIETLKANPDSRSIPIVGFLSHVQVDLKKQAEAAGCDYVVPRSLFSQALGRIVSGDLSLLGPRATPR